MTTTQRSFTVHLPDGSKLRTQSQFTYIVVVRYKDRRPFIAYRTSDEARAFTRAHKERRECSVATVWVVRPQPSRLYETPTVWTPSTPEVEGHWAPAVKAS